MLKHRSLTKFSATLSILALGVSLLLIACGWFFIEYKQYLDQRENLKTEAINAVKTRIKDQVSGVVQYIDYMESKIDRRTRRMLKEEVETAYDQVEAIYAGNKNDMSEDRLKTLVRETLRPLRFNDRRGYFFIVAEDGMEILFADKPELEGKYLKTIDSDGKHVIKDIIELATTRGEGYYSYRWTRPGVPGNEHLKISFVKLFKPFGWIIGAGEYYEDMEAQVKQEALDRIAAISFDKDSYIFAFRYDGYYLSHPQKGVIGQNMLHVEDSKGFRVNEKLVALCRDEGGGFLEYTWRKPSTGEEIAKLAYVEPYPEWEWVIGTGVYLDDVDKSLTGYREIYEDEILQELSFWCVALFLAALSSFALIKYQGAQLRHSVDAIYLYFSNAFSASREIDIDKIAFDELRDLAVHANKIITKRVRDEEELARLQVLLSNVVNSMPSALVAVDADGNVTLWNNQAERSLGTPAREAVGRPFEKAAPRLAGKMSEMRLAIQTGETKNLGRISSVRNGNALHEEVTVYPLAGDGATGATGMVVRIDDVTRRVMLEDIMVQTEKMMSVGGLAAGMAHEINNPLGIILGSLQNLERRLDPEFKKNLKTADDIGFDLRLFDEYARRRGLNEMFASMGEAAVRAARIVKNMLDFSRRSESKMAPHDVGELLDKVLELAKSDYDLKKKYDIRNIVFRKDYDPEAPKVGVCETEIEQVFLNLIKNAAHAVCGKTFEVGGPEIVFRTRRDGDGVRVEIEDNGVGLDEATRKRVFEPFFTTKPPDIGTGLGLSVSYFIITHNHGGSFHVESEPGRWTKFSIRLSGKTGRSRAG